MPAFHWPMFSFGLLTLRVDVTAGELHGRLAAALERHVDELRAGRAR